MPKQLKASKVERIVNEITNQRNNIMSSKGEGFIQEMFEIEMKEKYPIFAEDYKQLFSQSVTGTLEPGMFKYMIMMLNGRVYLMGNIILKGKKLKNIKNIMKTII